MGDHTLLVSVSASLFVAYAFSFFLGSYWRLRKIPGPPLALFTNFWLWGKFWNGGNWRDISTGLHEKYGPVVRYGPSRVMFNDAAAIPDVFSTSKLLEKGDNYNVIKGKKDGKEIVSMLSLRPESRHTAIKKALGPIFTPNAVLDFEPHVDDNIETLVQQLRESASSIDLSAWLMYFTFDTICRIGFGEELGMMKTRVDKDGVIEGARSRFRHWHYWLAVPWVEALIFKSGILPKSQKKDALFALAAQKIRENSEKQSEAEKPAILGKFLAAQKKYPDIIDHSMVLGLSVSVIHAGAETVAATCSIAMYHLLRNPAALAKLRYELDTLESGQPAFRDLNKLRYLDAAIKESMRLTPIANNMLEKIAPPDGVEIAGTWIPGNTTVSVSHHMIHMDESIFGEDVHTYRPERWLEAEHSRLQAMERANMPFGAGKRVCTGQHIAWIELKKLIACLLTNFEIALEHPDREIPIILDQTVASVINLPVRIEAK